MIVGIHGAGRDGSTLLMRLLDGAPNVWVYPLEIKFLDQIAPADDLRRWRARPEQFASARVPRARLEPYARFQLSELRKNYASRLHEPVAVPELPPDVPDGVSYGVALEWFLGLAAPADARLLAFKTTEALDARLYETAVPALRTIRIVREPLDQYTSTKRTVLERPGFLYWALYSDVLSGFVERWVRHAEDAADAVARDPARHTLVRFEDLRREPAREVARLCDWLGVAHPPDPELQTVFGGRRMRELPANPSKAGAVTPERVVADTASLFGYHEVVSKRERAVVAACTEAAARRVGYDVPSSPVGLRLAARWIAPAPWELRQVRRRPSAVRDLLARRRFVLQTARRG